jgi:hypothetical protein
MYDSLVLAAGRDLTGLSGPKTSSPSAMSFSSGIEMVASSAKVEFLADAPGPENNGAGGNGLRGLPPYLELGVPGLDLPSISLGSNCTFGGGRVNSLEPLVGLQDRVGEILPLLAYGMYEPSDGFSGGAVSMIEGARECEEDTDGW